MSDILVGVPSYCGARDGENDLLGWCLRAIRERSDTKLDFDLVVVDDSGSAAHREASQKVCAKYNAIWRAHEANRGIAVGWNTLVRLGAGHPAKYNVLLNDDVLVCPGWLDALIHFLRENDGVRIGAVGLRCDVAKPEDVPVILGGGVPPLRDPFTKFAINPDAAEVPIERGHDSPPTRHVSPLGCLFAFTRESYDAVLGFNEAYESMYEEIDFGASLAAQGLPSFNLHWPRPHHLWSATFGRCERELDPQGRMTASRAKFMQKWNGRHFETLHEEFVKWRPLRSAKWLGPSGPQEGRPVDGGPRLEV